LLLGPRGLPRATLLPVEPPQAAVDSRSVGVAVCSMAVVFTPRTRILTGVVLAIAAVVWLRVNNPVEGRILVVVTPNHGLSEADLPALAVLIVAALLILTARR
jgi:hypothetical protein